MNSALFNHEQRLESRLTAFFSKRSHRLLGYGALLLLITLLYYVFCFSVTVYPLEGIGYRDLTSAILFGVLLVLILGFFIFILVLKGKNHALQGEDFARFFLGAGILFLLFYGFLISWNGDAGSHDWSYLQAGGHWSIVHQIYTDFSFPAVNLQDETYQPRFWHLLVALWMRFNGLFIHLGDGVAISNASYSISITEYACLDTARILMAYIGILGQLLLYRIYTHFGFKGIRLACISGFSFFTPVLSIVYFYHNNDGLAFFFMLAALYFTLTYREKGDWFSLVMIAISIGAGMEAKLNAALVAVFTAFVFILILVSKIKQAKLGEKKPLQRFLLQILVFALIVFPLGLGWSLYAALYQGERFGYVLDLGHDMTYYLYIDPSFYNPALRFLLFPSPDLFFSIFNHRELPLVNGVYVNHWGDIDFNCWTAFYKTSLFGEADLGLYIPQALTVILSILFYGTLAFIWASFIVFAVDGVRRFFAHGAGWKKTSFTYWSLLLIALVMGGNYAYFCYAYPVGCTQNARYALLLLLPLGALLGSVMTKGIEALSPRNPKKKEA